MNYTQWMQPGENVYFPAGEVVKDLPPGYYSVDRSMQGIYFERKPIKNEELIRFPDTNSDAVLEEIQKFWKLENRFRESKIPYKRGLILVGPPGSGKTCTIRLAVDDLIKNHNGIVVDFPGCGRLKEGYEILRHIHESMPLVVLMEDVDAIMNSYDESEILNLLDGMYGIDRTIFLATTNYPERLKSNVMNRPTRFDKKIFVGMPNEEARRMFISSKLKESTEEEIERWVEDTEGFSIAHIKELFVATQILSDDYNSAVETLKGMHSAINSSQFDQYKQSNIALESKGKMTENNSRQLMKEFYQRKEDYYNSFGIDGSQYRQCKEDGNIIEENVNLSDIDSIAGIINEDIYDNNGLV